MEKCIPFIIHEAPMTVGESRLVESINNKPVAEGILQDGDVINRNRRCYATADLKAQIMCERTKELLRTGNMKGEQGHPMSDKVERQSTIDPSMVVVKYLDIKVEGNCDEWGTDEYNYALGLKRAKSAKDALVRNGVSADRIAVVSFGESNPVCTDKTKACDAQNRRADFKVLP